MNFIIVLITLILFIVLFPIYEEYKDKRNMKYMKKDLIKNYGFEEIELDNKKGFYNSELAKAVTREGIKQLIEEGIKKIQEGDIVFFDEMMYGTKGKEDYHNG